MSRRSVARVALSEVHELAEGPLWDTARDRLIWVDIRRGTVFSGELHADGSLSLRDRYEFGETVGAVAVSLQGEMLVAGTESLLVHTRDGRILPGPRILPSDGGRRLNDGKVDPAGRFLIGSLRLHDAPSQSETLSVVDQAGVVSVLDDDLTLSNGLGWSADGRILYNVDTLRQTIFARTYDPASGDTGPRRSFLTFSDGFPDGMCMDAEDHLWVAMWGLGEVHRISPAAQLVEIIEVPAPHTSSVAFAGPFLDTLVITTATQSLDADALARYPESGKLFTAKPLVLGAPVAPWGGFASTPTPLTDKRTP